MKWLLYIRLSELFVYWGEKCVELPVIRIYHKIMINSEKLLTLSSFILFSLDRAHNQRSTKLIKNKPKPRQK